MSLEFTNKPRLSHSCKGVCSGWQDGFEAGKKDFESKFLALLDDYKNEPFYLEVIGKAVKQKHENIQAHK